MKRVSAILFPVSIFTSACLLFLVQPILARFILPWFGGSPAVWTTCMLFFQVLLLLGYSCSHFVVMKLPLKSQAIFLLAFALLTAMTLNIRPAESWSESAATAPVTSILGLLTFHIGLPYVLLAMISPLIQAWFAITNSETSPFRLYALSNTGSILA
ncbi:hypothetical protein BVY02_02515, partial [bacterium J17]